MEFCTKIYLRFNSNIIGFFLPSLLRERAIFRLHRSYRYQPSSQVVRVSVTICAVGTFAYWCDWYSKDTSFRQFLPKIHYTNYKAKSRPRLSGICKPRQCQCLKRQGVRAAPCSKNKTHMTAENCRVLSWHSKSLPLTLKYRIPPQEWPEGQEVLPQMSACPQIFKHCLYASHSLFFTIFPVASQTFQ